MTTRTTDRSADSDSGDIRLVQKRTSKAIFATTAKKLAYKG
jgi:hypothetical protein